jgi:hypothetical protein
LTTLLSRAGTVLLVAGLALVLLSAIPPRKIENTDFRGTVRLQPRTFSIESTFYTYLRLNPQYGIYINAQANSTVTATLLSLGNQYIQQWITDRYPESQPSSNLNTSIMEDLLNNHPYSIAWQDRIENNNLELQYTPTKLMNVTLIFSNTGTENAKVTYNGKLLNFIVPSERALNPAKIVVPVGVVLTLPWLNSTLKQGRHKKIATTIMCSA